MPLCPSFVLDSRLMSSAAVPRRFPTKGGTGAIWKGVAKLLPADKQRYSQSVTAVDKDAKVVTLADGKKIQYNALIRYGATDALISSACL